MQEMRVMKYEEKKKQKKISSEKEMKSKVEER